MTTGHHVAAFWHRTVSALPQIAGLLIMMFLCAPSLHAAGIVSEVYQLLMGPVLSVVLLLIICGGAYYFMQGQVKAALVAIAILIFIVLVRHLVMGDGGTSGGYFHDRAASTSALSVQWPVYGSRPGSPVFQGSQQSGHTVIGGYALMGVTLLHRLMTSMLGLGFFGLVLMIAMVLTIIKAAREQAVSPLLWFLLRVALVGGAALWPIVAITQSGHVSPVIEVFQSMGGDPDAGRRVPIVAALTFSGATDFAESVGGALNIDTGDLDMIIYNASRSAQLPADIVADYHLFADNCFTAILNMTYTPAGDDGSQGELSETAGAFLRNSVWSLLRDDVRERLTVFQRQPRYLQHALSAPAEMLFKNVDYETYVINDRNSAGYTAPLTQSILNIYNDTYYVARRGRPGRSPIMPWSPHPYRHALVQLDVVEGGTNIHLINLAHGARVDAEKPSGADYGRTVALSRAPRITGQVNAVGRTQHRLIPRLFCSLHDHTEFNADGSWRDEPRTGQNQPWTLREDAPESVFPLLRPRDYQEYLRMRIAMRYISDEDSLQVCSAASADPSGHPDFWGCLVAGRYNFPSESTTGTATRLAYRVQQRFEAAWRDPIIAHAIGSDIAQSTIRPRMSLALSTMHDALVPRHQGSIPRHFVDQYVLAHGVQRQMSMDVYGEGEPDGDMTGEDDSWLYRFVTRLGGIALTGFASLFAWVASIMTTVALALYPHVIGLATLLLLLVYPVFAIMCFVPGKGAVLLEWMKSVLWLCLWPIFIGIGVGLINQTGTYALADFFVQVDDVDISASVLQIFGSMFIFMAPTFAGMVLALSFGALQQGVGGILGTGFKLAGVAAMITASLAGLATTLLGGVAGGALGGALGAGRAGLTSGPGAPASGGGGNTGPQKDVGPRGPERQPGPTGVGQSHQGAPSFSDRVMAGVRRGGHFGARVATTGSEMVSAQGFAIVQGVDFTGGQFTQGGWAGIQAGHATQQGVVGRDGLIEAGRDLMRGQEQPQQGGGAAVTAGRTQRRVAGGAVHATAAMTIGDERHHQSQATRDPDRRQQLLGEAAVAHAQAQEAYAHSDDWAAAARAGQQSFQEYMEAGDLTSAARVGAEAMQHAERALHEHSGDRRVVAQAQLVRGTVAAQLGLGHWSQAQRLDDHRRPPLLSQAQRYLSIASEDLTEARHYDIQEAHIAAERIKAEPTPQSYAAYEHHGMSAIDAARMHDQVSVARGAVSRDAEHVFDTVRQPLERYQDDAQVHGILQRFQKRMR